MWIVSVFQYSVFVCYAPLIKKYKKLDYYFLVFIYRSVKNYKENKTKIKCFVQLFMMRDGKCFYNIRNFHQNMTHYKKLKVVSQISTGNFDVTYITFSYHISSSLKKKIFHSYGKWLYINISLLIQYAPSTVCMGNFKIWIRFAFWEHIFFSHFDYDEYKQFSDTTKSYSCI